MGVFKYPLIPTHEGYSFGLLIQCLVWTRGLQQVDITVQTHHNHELYLALRCGIAIGRHNTLTTLVNCVSVFKPITGLNAAGGIWGAINSPKTASSGREPVYNDNCFIQGWALGDWWQVFSCLIYLIFVCECVSKDNKGTLIIYCSITLMLSNII